MPFFDTQSRDQLRRMYVDAWRKHRQGAPLEPVEAQVADVVAAHPEYHPEIEGSSEVLNRDYSPDDGRSNPFLHMGLHLAIRDQLATDRPAGVRAAFVRLAAASSEHDAEHRLIDCLAEALWNAQRSGRPPDEAAYLAQVKRLAGMDQ
jgi:hypothetical protein